MLGDPGCPPITIDVAYRDAARVAIAQTFVLSPKQFEGLTRLGESIEEDVASSLKKLVKLFENVVSEGKLHVATSSEHPLSTHACHVGLTIGQGVEPTLVPPSPEVASVAEIEPQAVAVVAAVEPSPSASKPAAPQAASSEVRTDDAVPAATATGVEDDQT
ncbi:MAG: hypothetical protein M3680_00030 [Myxococcota bacterium]|nr:hypothetical protein [Myxococcota bacterium]